MEKINERMYQANVELVERNKLLEEDKKILQKRMNKAVEYTENKISMAEQNFVKVSVLEDILDILQGRYVDNGDK